MSRDLHRSSDAMAERSALVRWVGLCALGEVAGIGAAAVWYGAVNVWVGEPGPGWMRIGAWALMSLAAVPEGLFLGGLQVLALRWFIPQVSPLRWIFATITVGALGWGIGSFIPLFMADAAGVDPAPEPSWHEVALFAAVFGLAVGAVFGLAQAWAFPPGTGRRYAWIPANAVGWAVGLPLIYVAAQAAADQSGWLARIALWTCGGLGAGLSVGIATGVCLHWMAPDRGRNSTMLAGSGAAERP